ncbi:Transposon Ty3-I Gag-Pol polyprotein [Gossypium australe]|uniref:Transposon Ty3-I Gag-Pol polyprotein n=1 Tax=Gossypium australe TaxID=47621 RepID=A0A5B6UUT0_9ROSI|nr:Transposon Ty3-I Gag-Pol polyprotein [Gossypium australe]
MIRYAYEFVKRCDRCQRKGKISKIDEMPQKGILEYILLALDYVSKWIKTVALPMNDMKAVALITDEGSHFYSRQLESTLCWKKVGLENAVENKFRDKPEF